MSPKKISVAMLTFLSACSGDGAVDDDVTASTTEAMVQQDELAMPGMIQVRRPNRTLRIIPHSEQMAAWVEQGPSSRFVDTERTATLPIRIILKNRNVDVMKAELEAISNPNNPRYLQWKSVEEINDICQLPDARRQVTEYLSQTLTQSPEKIIKPDMNVTVMVENVTIKDAAALLQSEFYRYRNETTGAVMDAPREQKTTGLFTIPEVLKEVVDGISFITP